MKPVHIRPWLTTAGLCLLAVTILAAIPGREIADPCLADIDLDGYGTITVALDSQAAPETVDNFVSLARSGFYDGLTIYRAVEGFLIEGGAGADNTRKMKTIQGEFAENGVDNPLSHTRGAISMARDEDYNSASSRFFIVQEDSTYLDGSYAAFGYVVSGMEIVDQICLQTDAEDRSGFLSREQQPVITSVSIREP